MGRKKLLGWIMIFGGAWFLITGIATNDRGGITGLGYNPDVPVSFGFTPIRFILGILLCGAIIVFGIRMVTKIERGDDR